MRQLSTAAPFNSRYRARADADADAAAVIASLSGLAADDPRRPAVRQAAIEAWLPMAHRLARRYASRRGVLEDLQQTAAVGLIKAVDRFDPDRNIDFPAYAIPTIMGELKRYFRDRGSMIRLPRRLHDLYVAITEVNGRLTQTLNRKPIVSDIASDLHVTEEEIIEALEAGHALRPESLSVPISADGRQLLGDTIGTEDYGHEFTEWHLDLTAAVAGLTDRERQILQLRFYDELTQTEIAERVGLSQMQISRLLSATLTRLRTQLSPELHEAATWTSDSKVTCTDG
jgi:RNA polymerase sigma-B factor